MKNDFYLASPFFNEEQVEREEAIKKILRDAGFTVFSPKENCFLPAKSTAEDRQRVFKENTDAIFNSKMVFAITDGKDVGTIFEAGVAFSSSIPIVYFAETLGDNPFNLMLAASGRRVFKSREEVIKNVTKESVFKLYVFDDFSGDIE